MRWVNLQTEGRRGGQAAILEDDGIRLHPSGASLSALIVRGELRSAAALVLAQPVEAMNGRVLLAPVPRPPSVRDFIAFEEHIVNALGAPAPTEWFEIPVFYFTNPAAILGATDSVPRSPGSVEFDFELEIGVVIGEEISDANLDNAGETIAGYTLFIDWSARDLQLAEMKVGLGPAKGKDTATTLGPTLVTPDEIEPFRCDDGFDLDGTVKVNGVSYISTNFRGMHWTFEQMIVQASRGTTLYPGDVIGSGTAGNGCILELQRICKEAEYPWLVPGDEVSFSVDVLGSITTRIVESAPVNPLVEAQST